MRVIPFVFGMLLFCLLSEESMAGEFGKPSFRLSTAIVSDDNFFRDNQNHPSGDADTLFPFKVAMKNSYRFNERFRVPFGLGASYNWYNTHSNSSYSALDGSIGLAYNVTRETEFSLSYSADNYLKTLGTAELFNKLQLSADYDISKEFTLKAGAGEIWFNSTPSFTYTGNSVSAGAVYRFSRATVLGVEQLWLNKNYAGGTRNDSRNELILALYQAVAKDVVGAVIYYSINNSSDNAIYNYSRNLYSLGIRYHF